jgi:hypothetical protein
MYTKTHEVMLAKQIKKLKKEIDEINERHANLFRFVHLEFDRVRKIIGELQDATINRKIKKDGK